MTTITIDKKIAGWKIGQANKEQTKEGLIDIEKKMKEEYRNRLEKELGHSVDDETVNKRYEAKYSSGLNTEKPKTNIHKRPKELPCEIHQVKVKGEAWTIFVGLLDGKAYEIFGGLSKYIEIPKKYKSGILVKNGKIDGISTYNLILGKDDDQFLIKDLVSVFENKVLGSFTRLISLSLRHDVPVQYIVEQLNKDNSDITSFAKVIARVLKNYIVEKKSGAACPKCGANNVVFDGGCFRCLDCCYEKCG